VRPRTVAREGRRLASGEIAWLLAAPCAVITVAAMELLGGPLGRLVLSHRGHDIFLPEWRFALLPKPAEQGSYLIGLAAPVLLAVATLILARRSPRLRSRTAKLLVRASECAGATFVIVCMWVQRDTLYGATTGYPLLEYPHGFMQPFFTLRTLLAAAVLSAVVALAVRSDPMRRRAAKALNSQRRGLAAIGLVAAVFATVIWLLAGVNLGDTIRNATGSTIYNVKWPLDETFAVLDGRTPLVNFTAQYGSLWPYATALIMSVLGSTFGVFSVTMCAITGISLLAVFATLRRVTNSAVAALLLYLPFLANGFFTMEPGLVNRYGGLTLYALFPLRYAGPYLLVWLTARHLDLARPRQRWVLFLVAGLVVINNVDFGIPALGATFAAMLWVGLPLRWTSLSRLIRDTLAGLLAAYALVSILTLLRAGSLPRLGVMLFFSRIYGLDGWAQLPSQQLGIHIVIYLTYVAAIGTAAVFTVRRDPRRLLSGLLAWSGIFGLGLGGYYMGRSGPETAIAMFSAWTLTLALLAIAVVQRTAHNPAPRLTIAHVAVFFGMSVAACSLAQTPAPWTQIARLKRTAAPIDVASPRLKQTLIHYGQGKPEAIMNVVGDRVAYESGIVDVSPYIGTLTVFTTQQVSTILRALHNAGGRLLVLPVANTYEGFYRAVCVAGFSFIGQVNVAFEHELGKPNGLTLWSAPIPGVAPRPCPIQ
jgi:hypothetical protein